MTVTDTTDPVVTAPAAVTTEATGAGTTVTLGTATATDLVDGSVAVTNDAPATFPVGSTIVTWSATDAAGNIGTATQTVTVTDTTNPVVIPPVDITAKPKGNGLTQVDIGQATATDNVEVTSITNDAPSAGFPKGITIVTWTAADAEGNQGTATQTINITKGGGNGGGGNGGGGNGGGGNNSRNSR